MLDINMEFKQGILLVRLKGLLNGDTVGILKKDLEMIIKDNGIKYVLINLKNLSYVDYYGLEAIKQSYKQITANNGKLIICGINNLFENNNIITNNLLQIKEEQEVFDYVTL